jgi:hypothetical protein
MNRKYVISLAAAVLGSAALAATAVHADGGWGGGFGHHGRHGGSLVRKVCLVALPADKHPEVKGIFEKAGPGLKTDFETVKKDREAVADAILSRNDSGLTSAENTLNTDAATLRSAQEAVTAQICGLLDQDQLGKAKTLYGQLQANRETVHGYFEAARP